MLPQEQLLFIEAKMLLGAGEYSQVMKRPRVLHSWHSALERGTSSFFY
jgi:hypothetical protein